MSGSSLIADVYGGVYRMTSQVYEPKGYVFEYVPAGEFSNLRDRLDERTRIVWIETPSNPLLNVVDIRRPPTRRTTPARSSSSTTRSRSPYLQTPLDLGADVVVHSTTKYLGGHSDVIGGFAATNDPTIAERLFFLQKSLGAVPGPVRLVARSARDQDARASACASTARTRAPSPRASSSTKRSSASTTPGSRTHPGHEIATRQMRDFGGMVSFLAESEEAALELVARTKIWKLAESLGGVESMIERPARMTHASTADAPFAPPKNLVRLSVGIESADDLVADLEQALVRSAAHA